LSKKALGIKYFLNKYFFLSYNASLGAETLELVPRDTINILRIFQGTAPATLKFRFLKVVLFNINILSTFVSTYDALI